MQSAEGEDRADWPPPPLSKEYDGRERHALPIVIRVHAEDSNLDESAKTDSHPPIPGILHAFRVPEGREHTVGDIETEEGTTETNDQTNE